MGSKFIVVVGNGETTRSNIEALVADFFYDKSRDYILLLPFIDRPSQGQVWAHQIFQDFKMTTTAIAPEGSVIMNLGGASLTPAPNPVEAVIEVIRGEEAYVFVLPEEDHQIDLTGFTEAGVPCYNLCLGLMAINAVEPVQKPAEPVSTAVQTPLPGPSSLHADIRQLVDEFSTALLDILKEHGLTK